MLVLRHGPWRSPTTIEASHASTTGVVELALRVRWSGPPRTYDLAVRRDRILVYEQVMVEGTDDDLRRFIDVDEVVALWAVLVLPRHVRRAWATWLRERRRLMLSW